MPRIRILDAPFTPDTVINDVGEQPVINSTIKPIDRKKANSEVEIGEKILRNDLTGLWTAKGKRHSQGGTPTLLNEGDFVFSNDKSLSFSKKESKLFEFKHGGSVKDNTPAKMVDRMVKPEDYNKMLHIIQNPDKDRVSKNSATLMQQKYQEILGQVAYLQEAKKGFPQGLPEFAQNTAPVYDTETKQNIEQEDQFMARYGGSKPLNKYQLGSLINPNTFWQQGMLNPNMSYNPAFLTADQLRNRNVLVQQVINNQLLKNQVCNTPECIKARQQQQQVQQQRKRTAIVTDQPFKMSKPGEPATVPPGLKPAPPPSTFTGNVTPFKGFQTTPTEEAAGPYNPRVPLSPLQKANLAYSIGQSLDINKYMPMRSQIKSPLVELNQLNPTPYLNQLNTTQQQAFQATQALNPILAAAQQQNIYGQGLQQGMETLGNINNQNIEIANRQNIANQAIQAGDLRTNIAANQDYYNQVQAANQAFDNERRFAQNQSVSLFNQYMGENQQLEQALASQRTYGTRINPRTGQREAAPLYDVDVTGWRPRVYYTGADVDPRTLGVGQSNKMDDITTLFDLFISKGATPDVALKEANRLSISKNFNLNQPTQYGTRKKGGEIKSMRRK